ncbi:hypothetical protein [Haloarchaeobius sp. HRN-SO-5]|uniref:hypothetical protein n=1 Tax=Haloarchaeobius sp. HRN-SO-5 TaxID=3446118 RepID=UPI003EBBF8DD
MQDFPPTPTLADAPDALLDGGHLWIRELVSGTPFRFQLRPSGVLHFGDADAVYDPAEVPLRYQHAVRHVRTRFDRAELRASVDAVESVTFLGVAVDQRAVDYDWRRTPSFLGTDVYHGERGRFLPLDAAEQVYAGLGLDPVVAFEKEVRAVDFDPDDYAIPDSTWADGPAAGVVLRDKTGDRAVVTNPAVPALGDSALDGATAAELVDDHVTDRWLDGLVSHLGVDDDALGFDALFERAVEALARERARAFRDGSVDTDESVVRSAMADRVESYLVDRRR